MVENQNAEITKVMSEELKESNLATLPRNVSNNIQPVLQVNQQPEVKILDGTASDAVSSTLMTTSSNKDTYIVGAQLTVSKDAVSDSTTSYLALQPKGDIFDDALRLRYEPSTAGSHHIALTFPIPILLERNTAIRVHNQTATASIDATAIIYYYEVDTLQK